MGKAPRAGVYHVAAGAGHGPARSGGAAWPPSDCWAPNGPRRGHGAAAEVERSCAGYACAPNRSTVMSVIGQSFGLLVSRVA